MKQKPIARQYAWHCFIMATIMFFCCSCDSCNSKSSATPTVVTATISPSVNTAVGVNGVFQESISTNFFAVTGQDQVLTTFPNALETENQLKSKHIRIIVIPRDIPQTSPTAWDFSYLDNMVGPLQSIGDQSVEIDIGMGPSFMYDSNGNFIASPSAFGTFCMHIAQYYSIGAFTDEQGVTHTNPNFDPHHPVLWYGIYNEPDGNGIDAATYANLYNAAATAMLSINPSLHFVGGELVYGAQGQQYIQTLISNLAAPLDVVSYHDYALCGNPNLDAQVFDTIPIAVQEAKQIVSVINTNPRLKNTQVWMTENNINANFPDANGNSSCGIPNQAYIPDARNSTTFFAAYRPWLFSQLGQAGVSALYHFEFIGGVQFGELNENSGDKQLSYWVDYWLGRAFSSSPGQNILHVAVSDPASVEVLATKAPDNTVEIMVVNHAVKNPSTDIDGLGAPLAVTLDLSLLGSFNSGNQVTIDGTTNVANGPVTANVTPAAKMTINFPDGYGVSFLTLKQ